MSAPSVVLELSSFEVAHLRSLVEQFSALVTGDDAGVADPAVARLVPDAYSDPEAAREFRALTEGDLLQRRAADAGTVLATLLRDGAPISVDELDQDAAEDTVPIVLDGEGIRAWLRTLAALRLVLATRLGIVADEDGDPGDPRYGVYEWLGYRLDWLVRSLEP